MGLGRSEKVGVEALDARLKLGDVVFDGEVDY